MNYGVPLRHPRGVSINLPPSHEATARQERPAVAPWDAESYGGQEESGDGGQARNLAISDISDCSIAKSLDLPPSNP